jgi:hypothetical protein
MYRKAEELKQDGNFDKSFYDLYELRQKTDWKLLSGTRDKDVDERLTNLLLKVMVKAFSDTETTASVCWCIF